MAVVRLQRAVTYPALGSGTGTPVVTSLKAKVARAVASIPTADSAALKKLGRRGVVVGGAGTTRDVWDF